MKRLLIIVPVILSLNMPDVSHAEKRIREYHSLTYATGDNITMQAWNGAHVTRKVIGPVKVTAGYGLEFFSYGGNAATDANTLGVPISLGILGGSEGLMPYASFNYDFFNSATGFDAGLGYRLDNLMFSVKGSRRTIIYNEYTEESRSYTFMGASLTFLF